MTETEKLKDIAEQIKNPVFHVRGTSLPDGYLGDSFGAILKRKVPDSLGSGLYVTSNVQEVIEWQEYKKECYGTESYIYLYDLGDAKHLKTFESNEALDRYTDFLGTLTKYVLDNLYFSHYSKNGAFRCSDKEFDNECQKFCEEHNTTVKDIKDWTHEQRKTCIKLTGSNELMGMESLATRFQKDLLGINGIDTSNLIESDSVSLGSLVFDTNSISPLYDFGVNTELARNFYKTVHDKIIDQKLIHIPIGNLEAIKDLAFWGYDSIKPDYSMEDYISFLSDRQNYITFQNSKKASAYGESFEDVLKEARKNKAEDARNEQAYYSKQDYLSI